MKCAKMCLACGVLCLLLALTGCAAKEQLEEPASVMLTCGVEIALDAEVADLRGYVVDDLKGLEQCTELKELYVDQGQLSDVTLLANLENLEIIHLNNVPVTDIRCLGVLEHLRELDIKDTKVTSNSVQEFQASHGTPVQINAYVSRKYEAITEPCMWSDATTMAEQMGGHLATVQSQDEFEEICAIADRTGLSYFWLGGVTDGETWTWITGEEWNWDQWYPGEPGAVEDNGVIANRLCMCKVNDEWSFNDLPDDLSGYSFVTSGPGYVIEYEELSGYQTEDSVEASDTGYQTEDSVEASDTGYQTEDSIEASDKKDQYTAYSELLLNTPDIWSYSLCDLNQDGVLELMLLHGNSQADVTYEVYTYDGKQAVDCGSLRGDHCVLLYQDGEIWSTHCHMFMEVAYRVTLKNGVAEQEFLYEKEATISEDEVLYTFATCSEDELVPVSECFLDVDLTLLQSYFSD